MNTLFEDLEQGLNEAISVTKELSKSRRSLYIIDPENTYSAKDVRQIRMEAHMTQSEFAEFMNVSKKTVEAWEAGTNKVSGPACRLITLLKYQDGKNLPFLHIIQK